LHGRHSTHAAPEGFHSGKPDRLVVRGDSHVRGYGEPQAMKAALIEAGVPAAA